MKRKNCFLFFTSLLLLFTSISLFSIDMSSIEKSMDEYENEKRFQWSFNPFNRPKSDKFFSPWTDPLAYNSYWNINYITNADELYDREKFKLDNIIFYHNPQLATTIAPFAFNFNNGEHRLDIGVAFLWNASLAMYGIGRAHV